MRQPRPLHLTNHMLREVQAVDFVRALVDARHARLAEDLGDGEVLRVAVAAVNLHALVGAQVLHLRAVELQQGALARVLRRRLAVAQVQLGVVRRQVVNRVEPRLHQVSRAVQHALQREQVGRHPREFVAHQPEVGDGLSELLAVFGVAGGKLQRVFACAERAGCHLVASQIQRVERDVVRLADLAQQVLGGHEHILERHTPRAGTVQPDFMLLAPQVDARRRALHQKRSELLAVELGEHGEQVGEARVGDPHLLAR
jgi:hypothetical protein